MKKTIKILAEKMEKLQEKKDGTLQGGFASVKGGLGTASLGTNDTVGGCSNTFDCSKSTNVYSCTNSMVCFM